MTLETALIILAIATAIVAALLCYWQWADLELQRLAAYDEWTTRFYAGAKSFLESSDVPHEWDTIIEYLNEMIADKSAARAMYKVFSRRRKGPLPSAESFSKEEETFIKAHPEAFSDFFRTVIAGLLAISYNSAFWGVKARAVLAERFGRNDQPTVTSRDVKEMTMTAHHAAA